MTQTKPYRRSFFVATGVLGLGIAASLAGNLQAINLGDAAPGVGAYVSAIWWPLSLFLSIELLIHTPWLRAWRDWATRAAVLGLVAAVAGWVSYWHLAHVLSSYGYDVASRYAGPLAVDATMVLATLALNRVVTARRAVQDTPPAVDNGQDTDTQDLAPWTVASNQPVTYGMTDKTGLSEGGPVSSGQDVVLDDLEQIWTLSSVLPQPVPPVVPGDVRPVSAPPATGQRIVRTVPPNEMDQAVEGLLAHGESVADIKAKVARLYGVSIRTVARRIQALQAGE